MGLRYETQHAWNIKIPCMLFRSVVLLGEMSVCQYLSSSEKSGIVDIQQTVIRLKTP